MLLVHRAVILHIKVVIIVDLFGAKIYYNMLLVYSDPSVKGISLSREDTPLESTHSASTVYVCDPPCHQRTSLIRTELLDISDVLIRGGVPYTMYNNKSIYC